ncbi:MAG: hypothetical protein GAK43_01404 [Stenotrophomonas maltophilia]|nr:MAG: hypothetical protein GAK43_01404 [Stenotrophomonas maltophilia]
MFAAAEADWVVLTAWHPNSAAGLLAVVPAQRTGLERRSGRDGLICQDLRVHPEDVLLPPGWPPTPQTEACQALVRLLQANLALGLAAHAEAGLPASAPRQRLLGLGVRLIEAAAQPLDALLADVPGLDFRHSRVLANLCGQAEAVARRAAQESLQAQSLQARLLAFA